MSIHQSLPFPIYPALSEMKEMDFKDKPQYLIDHSLSDDQWTDYQLAFEFLTSYGMRSKETFNAYRSDIQAFMLWVWVVSDAKSLSRLRRRDIEAYVDFYHQPPREWVMSQRLKHFYLSQGGLVINPDWRPFRVPNIDLQGRSSRIKRNVAHASLLKLFSSISSFCDFLVDERHLDTNPVPAAKKRSPYMIKDAQIKTAHRLGEETWYALLEEVEALANDDACYERALFAILLMKTCYLRISELTERDAWSPTMGDFFEREGFMWLKIYGKGKKIRDVSVPDAFLPYLKRFRRWRKLSDMPEVKELAPLIPKTRGVGNIGQRQLTRLIDEAILKVAERLKAKGLFAEAKQLSSATTHSLRHTGASMDIDHRPLKHLSDELGHASLGTTDRIYVQSDQLERAQSGKRRKL